MSFGGYRGAKGWTFFGGQLCYCFRSGVIKTMVLFLRICLFFFWVTKMQFFIATSQTGQILPRGEGRGKFFDLKNKKQAKLLRTNRTCSDNFPQIGEIFTLIICREIPVFHDKTKPVTSPLLRLWLSRLFAFALSNLPTDLRQPDVIQPFQTVAENVFFQWDQSAVWIPF